MPGTGLDDTKQLGSNQTETLACKELTFGAGVRQFTKHMSKIWGTEGGNEEALRDKRHSHLKRGGGGKEGKEEAPK